MLDGVDGPGGERTLRTALAPDEHALPVPPLDVVGARLLFTQHGGPPEVWLEDLGGHPLAIVSAARRLQTVAPDALTVRLAASPFRVLDGIEDALQTTWDATPNTLQTAWSRLSRLEGGGPVKLATAVGVGPGEMQALRLRGLVERRGADWSMPSLYARFAEGRAPPVDTASHGDWHATANETRAAQVEEEVRESRSPEDCLQLEALWWALREGPVAARVASTLVPLWVVTGQELRAIRMVQAMLSGTPEVVIRAHVRGWLALAYGSVGRTALAATHARQVGDAGPRFIQALQAARSDASEWEALLQLTWAL